ncbi:Crt10p Ecym_5089 [Eremothecium cymbalariae DBVPG|uniref:Uncharacterized protein n=1 Tax=Eremothecium cymbalariae (strain CBS 270.75 / DBVPG 7215 / KCTC 17166 / NRRL Y-17582) TaxID=931890 RepID=I6NCT3_ERECY|nr:hypothetical protein Ecym_5089 [Eremothecium cymbalariae DBVPG\
MSELPLEDSLAFKRYLTSRGYVLEKYKKSYMEYEPRMKSKLNIKDKLEDKFPARWECSVDGHINLKHLKIQDKLQFSESFKSTELSYRDRNFIDSIKSSGSYAEPVWGSNGKYLNPADTLLPEWERLKIQENVTSFRMFQSVYRHGFDNNLICISQNRMLFIACGYEFLVIDLLRSEFSTKFNTNELRFNLLDSSLMYNPIPLSALNFFGHVVRDYRVHFIKACQFYNEEYVAMCCENGYIMMFLVDEFINYDMNEDENRFNRPVMKPKYILEAQGSCWSFDIYDDDPNVKYIAAGHNEGSEPTGITLFAHSTGMNRFTSTEVYIEHNVPYVSFVKNVKPSDHIALAYASIFGTIGTIILQRFIYTKHKEYKQGSSRIPWEYNDEQNFPNSCWTIIPVKKSDFHQVGQYEYLSNNFNNVHKKIELGLIYQDSLLLSCCPMKPSESSVLGIGADMAQILVPTSQLQLLNGYQCLGRWVEFKFTCANLLNGSGCLVPYQEAMIKNSCMSYNEEDSCFYFIPKSELPLGDEKLETGLKEAGYRINPEFVISHKKLDPADVNDLFNFQPLEAPITSFASFQLSFDEDVKEKSPGDCESILQCVHGASESFDHARGERKYPDNTFKHKHYVKVTRKWMTDDSIFFPNLDERPNNSAICDLDSVMDRSSLDSLSHSSTHEASTSPQSEVGSISSKEFTDISLTNHIEKLYRLYSNLKKNTRHNLDGPQFESPVCQEHLFLVTTNTRVYLVHSDPMIIKAMTLNDIFPTSDVTTCHPAIEDLNRISITCYIRELSCFVVASQMGLISILRLTQHDGLYSFRQEYILGWEHIPPNKRDSMCMSHYTVLGLEGSNSSCGYCNTAFPYYQIEGMDYIYVADDPINSVEEYVVLYIWYRDNLARYIIKK